MAERARFERELEDLGVRGYDLRSSPYRGPAMPGFASEAQVGGTPGDNRTEVRDTKMAPYRWICSITYEKNDGQPLEGGTGFLISDRHVLTAGHVIDEAGSGPAAPSLYVYPGRYYGGEPFGRFGVARSRVAKGNLDFGLITLTRAVGQGMFWWGHPSTNTAWWREELIPLQQLLTAAYPS